jgi:hypothetical protein
LTEWSICYSAGDKLNNAGVIKEKTFKSGTKGLTISMPVEELNKVLNMARTERRDWVNMMGFEKKPKPDRTADVKRSKMKAIEEELDQELDDEVPF